MPQVASDPTVHVHTSQLPRSARPPQSSDRAPSPFESLLDDGTQAADQTAPTPPDNKVASTDNSQAPAKANDSKAPAANDTATAASKPQDDESAKKPDDDGKAVCDAKTTTTAQLVDSATAGDDSKSQGDNKPADGKKTDKPDVAPTTTVVQTNTATDVIPVAPAPVPASTTPEQHDQGNPAPQQVTLAAATGLQLKSLDSGLPKGIAGKQTGSEKPADADQQADTGSTGD